MAKEVKRDEKRYFISIVEYGIANDDWEGWRMGRIEVYDYEKDPLGQYATYEGFLRLPSKAFEQLRDELDFKYFTKIPYLNLRYEE